MIFTPIYQLNSNGILRSHYYATNIQYLGYIFVGLSDHKIDSGEAHRQTTRILAKLSTNVRMIAWMILLFAPSEQTPCSYSLPTVLGVSCAL